MLGYDFCLAEYSLVNYIFFAPRVDFLSGNREGIYTVCGYVALQLIGTAFGRLVLASEVSPEHR
jgi:phosphatidylinositol glycan class W